MRKGVYVHRGVCAKGCHPYTMQLFSLPGAQLMSEQGCYWQYQNDDVTSGNQDFDVNATSLVASDMRPELCVAACRDHPSQQFQYAGLQVSIFYQLCSSAILFQAKTFYLLLIVTSERKRVLVQQHVRQIWRRFPGKQVHDSVSGNARQQHSMWRDQPQLRVRYTN